MDSKKVMGIVLVLLGAVMMIMGGVGLAGDGGNFFGESVGKMGSLIPLGLGLIFFTYGIKLFATVKETPQ